jgi:tetratricopeptide (TPR) repeat protein
MNRIGIAALAVSITIAGIAPAADAWVGQTVLLKLPGDPAERPAPKTRERVRFGKLDDVVVRVEVGDGDWLRVEQDGASRWIPKAEVVRLADAVDYCTQQIEKKPTPELYCRRGRARMVSGELVKAIADFTEATDLNEKFVAGHFYRAIAWQERKQFDKANANFKEALRLSADSDAAYVRARLAEMLWQQGQKDEAVKLLTAAAVSTDREHPDWWFRLAHWQLATGNRITGEKILDDLAPLFKVTKKSIAALADAKVPEPVIEKVKEVLDVSFSTRDAFSNKLAELLEEDEKSSYGETIIAKSASVEEFGPANFQVAFRLLNTSRQGEKQKETIRDAELHFRRAIHFDREPQASQARYTLARLLRATARPEEAERLLTEAIQRGGDDHPEWRIELAEWHRQAGRRDAAEREYDSAIRSLTKRLNANATDHDARIRLIECLRLIGVLRCANRDFENGKKDLARALEICVAGGNLADDPAMAARYKGEVALLLLAHYDATANDPATSPAERFAKLEQCLTMFRGQPDALRRLIVHLRGKGPEADKARAILRDLVDNGPPSAAVYMVVGNQHWEQGDGAAAKEFWQKANALPNCPAEVQNNLAWVIAFQDKTPDYHRALSLVNVALQKDDRPEFRGTRGHILAKLELYREALSDLEAAKVVYAKQPKNALPLYERLAEVCGKLGMEAEANRYKELAAKAASEQPKP